MAKTESKVNVILAADVVCYSTMMEENEKQTLKNLKFYRKIVEVLMKEQEFTRCFIYALRQIGVPDKFENVFSGTRVERKR